MCLLSKNGFLVRTGLWIIFFSAKKGACYPSSDNLNVEVANRIQYDRTCCKVWSRSDIIKQKQLRLLGQGWLVILFLACAYIYFHDSIYILKALYSWYRCCTDQFHRHTSKIQHCFNSLPSLHLWKIDYG